VTGGFQSSRHWCSWSLGTGIPLLGWGGQQGGQGLLWIRGHQRLLHKGPAARGDRGWSLSASVRLWLLASWEAGEAADPRLAPAVNGGSSSHVRPGSEHLLPSDVAWRKDARDLPFHRCSLAVEGDLMGRLHPFTHPFSPMLSAWRYSCCLRV
jgi:hypothetical protein